jgi:hypothetical protein
MHERVTIVLDKFQQMRLLAAAQALLMPSKFYGVTHRQARSIITQVVGNCPKGKPTGPTFEDCLAWLGMQK